jgi:glycosyltransferase involved in cell wall biosynthesis
VTVIGPHDPKARDRDLPRRHVLLPGLPLRNHPGVYLPVPSWRSLRAVAEQRFDVSLAQTGSAFNELGIWLRQRHRVPFLCVNTVHLPSVYNVVLPDRWFASDRVRRVFEGAVLPRLERYSVALYNRGDGLIVLSEGLQRYWRRRGVTVPIHVIPRGIDTSIYDDRPRPDPFAPAATRGGRLLVLCRHTREKGIARLLDLFAKSIAPFHPHATLTLVGDGPDHDVFKARAAALGIAHRTFFPGECGSAQAPSWYQHADLFLYTSLSETYGQVVSEALWCGLPAVAFADQMGVSQQIDDGVNGVLLAPGPDERYADERFAEAVRSLLHNPARRAELADNARRLAHQRSSPERFVARHYEAFAEASRHLKDSQPENDRAVHSFLGAARSLSRWTFVHLLAFAGGLLRAPAILNRNGQLAPSWDPPALPVSQIRSLTPDQRSAADLVAEELGEEALA